LFPAFEVAVCDATWCLFGVCLLEALEGTSETRKTIETSLKRKKIKELFSKSFESHNLRYGVDKNPSLSAIESLKSAIYPLIFSKDRLSGRISGSLRVKDVRENSLAASIYR
jgi:hypothetical protein